jgi:hypothetical protein
LYRDAATKKQNNAAATIIEHRGARPPVVTAEPKKNMDRTKRKKYALHTSVKSYFLSAFGQTDRLKNTMDLKS